MPAQPVEHTADRLIHILIKFSFRFFKLDVNAFSAINYFFDMAFGVIRFLNDNGINVPKDVKIVGMDNIIITDYYYPRLSSVDCLNTKVAEIVSKSLSDVFKQETKPIEYNIEPILVLRESSE